MADALPEQFCPEISPVHVFWTGGLDSSFRVLWLVNECKVDVQPHYVIDERRRSSDQEIAAMNNMRTRLKQIDFDAAARLRPTRLTKRLDIPVNKARRDAYETYRARQNMSRQYKYLSDYVDCAKVAQIEVGIEFRVSKRMSTIIALEDEFEVTARGGQLRKTCVAPEFAVFRGFIFPLIKTSKLQMIALSRATKWGELLDLTVSCQKPRENGNPCGRCVPCTVAGNEGLLHRLPLRARARWYIRKIEGRFRAWRKMRKHIE